MLVKGGNMMYNTVMLIGRLTAEPELTKQDDKKEVCHLTLAVQRTYKNSDGIYEADFIRCTLWDQIAPRICEYCHKGDLISVRGQLRTSTFTVNDEKKYSTEVVVDKIAFLANKSKDSEETKDDGE